jgi:hypothetical protein
MLFKRILPVVAAGAIMIAVVFGFTTYKQVSASAETAQAAIVQTDITGTDLGRGKGPQGDATSDQALATALGIDLTKLQAAYQTANAEALKEAVAAGLITQAQADNLANNNSGHFNLPGVKTSSINYEALLAKALGIDTAKLQAARATAYTASIDAAVKAGTMTQAQADLAKGRYALQKDAKFQAAMKSAYEAALKQAVTDGVITQAQADALLTAQTNTGAGVYDGSMGKGPGGGRGGPGGFGGQNAPNKGAKATPAPTTTP